jgi:amino acid transporter
MGRDGTAPWLFAQLHRKHDVPWNALHVIFGVGLVASLTSGALVGPYQSYVWWGTTTTFFALATYLLVHLANLTLNGRKAFNSPYALIGFLLVPVIGIGVDGYLLVRAFFIELWSQGWATGRSVILFDVGCALIAALVGRLDLVAGIDADCFKRGVFVIQWMKVFAVVMMLPSVCSAEEFGNNWRVRSSAEVPQSGGLISQASYQTDGWLKADIPPRSTLCCCKTANC